MAEKNKKQVSPTRVFDRLVKDLDNAERQELLKKIEEAFSQDEANPGAVDLPLEPEFTGDRGNWLDTYRSFSILKRIWLFFKSIIKSKPLEEITVQYQLQALGQWIEKQAHGLANLRMNQFHGVFHGELRDLFVKFKTLQEVLQRCFGPYKKEFVAYFLGREWQDVEFLLLHNLNLWEALAQDSLKADRDIKAQVESQQRKILDDIDENRKKNLYRIFRNLELWKELVFFPAASLLDPFRVGTTEQIGPAYFSDMKKPLYDFWSLSDTLEELPSKAVWVHVLYFYYLAEPGGEKDLQETTLEEGLYQFAAAASLYRQFRARVPLTALCQYLYNNLHLKIPAKAAGEDWFQIYRNFWQDRLDYEFLLFSRERRRKNVLHRTSNFLGMDVDEFLRYRNLYPDHWPLEVPQLWKMSFAFLGVFMEKLFGNFMVPLFRTILMDGEFYKSSNRKVFTEVYGYWLGLGNQIRDLQKLFYPENEWGVMLLAIKSEKNNQVALQKAQDLTRIMGYRHKQFLSETKEKSELFLDVIRGLVKGQGYGKFDTLSNISHLMGKNNAVFRQGLERIYQKWESFQSLYSDMVELEDSEWEP